MNVSNLFIIRPVMTTLVMATFLLFGLIAYNSLPVNDLPAVDFPTITVSASLPGASADTMASAVATPLEKQFSNIAGVEEMTSSSQLGTTSITLVFDLNRKIDGAAEDVQAAIVTARALLPTSMPTPPSFRKVNPADAPILFISLSSPTLPLYQVDEYAENMLAPRISMVNGVAQVQVFGSQVYAPHVQIDPRKLDSYGIGIDQVAQAISDANVNLPTGTLYGPDMSYNVMANGQLFNAAAFKPVIVAYIKGAPVRLEDLGTVIDSTQTDKVATWYNGTRAVVLAVQKQPNTNTIQIVQKIRQLFPTFKAIIPKSVSLDILFDRSIGIQRSVDEAKKTLLLTVVLVIIVIFIFLGNPSSTLIASTSLPISLIGTFAAMKLSGFTINNISLMALTLSVGFVVDDTIVVLENIVRHMELGESPMEAALKGSQEIGFTVISMTISLVAVFIPILLMGGIIGRLFFQFGATIAFAILISGFVSLSLTPMLCSRFLRKTGEHSKGLSRLSDLSFAWMQKHYESTLGFALKHKIWIVGLFVLMLGGTVVMLMYMPKGFIPTEDQGQIQGTTLAIEGISFDGMMEHQKKIATVVGKDPNVAMYMSSIGAGSGQNTANQGSLNLFLKPLGDGRNLKVDEVVQELRKKVAGIPGIKFFMQVPPSIRIGGRSAKALYQLTLSSLNNTELYAASDKLEAELHKIPDLQDVNSDLLMKNLELDVNIDREKLSQLGLSMEQAQDAMNSAYSQRQVSVIYTPTNQYWVILEALPQYYRDPTALQYMRIHTAGGQLVPLNTVATMKRTSGPLMVNHSAQFPSVTISFNVKPGSSLSDAVTQIKAAAAKTLPSDISYSFQGSAKAFESSTQDLGFLLIISILVIYIVLGMLYESFIHPITILSGLPSAGLGALIILLLCHKDLDIYGFLGLILLVGIVKKNAIMLVDFAVDAQRQENKTATEAIYQACLVRFRPIMMTTLAALLGSVPIAFATGQGSETRQPLGLTVVGGLLVSQIVTLYITPVFYVYLDRVTTWYRQRKAKRDLQDAAAAKEAHT
jgi:hydrophobic/amphiphilic exporter-1 (mainly G- bacteria), HAE1 family